MKYLITGLIFYLIFYPIFYFLKALMKYSLMRYFIYLIILYAVCFVRPVEKERDLKIYQRNHTHFYVKFKGNWFEKFDMRNMHVSVVKKEAPSVPLSILNLVNSDILYHGNRTLVLKKGKSISYENNTATRMDIKTDVNLKKGDVLYVIINSDSELFPPNEGLKSKHSNLLYPHKIFDSDKILNKALNKALESDYKKDKIFGSFYSEQPLILN